MKSKLMIAAGVVLLSGCATVGSLPQSTAAVDFDEVGQASDNSWHDGTVYRASKQEVMRAAARALKVNGFQIDRTSAADCSVIGSTGMTTKTWNTVAGVYCRALGEQEIEVHVVAKSTKDVNILAGDATTPIPPRIITSLSSYLSHARR